MSCLAMFYLFVWVTFVLPCSGSVAWIYPASDNLTFSVNDTVYFSWISDVNESDKPQFVIWCTSYGDDLSRSLLNPVSTNGSFPASPLAAVAGLILANISLCRAQVASETQILDEGSDRDDSLGIPIIENDDSYVFTINSNDTAAPQTFGGNPLPTTTAPSLSTSATTTDLSAISSKSSSSITSQSSASNNPLSAAAIAGISIGSLFCVLTIVLIIVLCRMAQTRRPRGEKHDLNGTETGPSHVDNTTGINEGNSDDTAGIDEGNMNDTAGIDEGLPFHKANRTPNLGEP